MKNIIIIALLLSLGNLHAQTFSGVVPNSGTNNIPDNSPDCAAGAGCLEITFDVTNIIDPIEAVEIDMDMTHTWTGDLNVILTAPDSSSHTIMWRTGSATGTGAGDSSDLAGVYNFTDEATTNFWDTAVALVGGTIPAGEYRTSGVGSSAVTQINSAFQSVANPNGTWVLTTTDSTGGDTGGISAANLFILTNSDIIFKNGFQ